MLKYLVISDEGLFFLNFVYYEYIEIYLMKDIIDVNINLRLCVKMVMKKCVKQVQRRGGDFLFFLLIFRIFNNQCKEVIILYVNYIDVELLYINLLGILCVYDVMILYVLYS